MKLPVDMFFVRQWDDADSDGDNDDDDDDSGDIGETLHKSTQNPW